MNCKVCTCIMFSFSNIKPYTLELNSSKLPLTVSIMSIYSGKLMKHQLNFKNHFKCQKCQPCSTEYCCYSVLVSYIVHMYIGQKGFFSVISEIYIILLQYFKLIQ